MVPIRKRAHVHDLANDDQRSGYRCRPRAFGCARRHADRGGQHGAVGNAATMMGADRFEVSVTFDQRRGGYVGTAPELKAPVVALSLGGLRRRIEALMGSTPSRRTRRALRSLSASLRLSADGCARIVQPVVTGWP